MGHGYGRGMKVKGWIGLVLLAGGLFQSSLQAGTTTFFVSDQVATLVATGTTTDTWSSEGYPFTCTRDKLFTGGVGLTNPIGRSIRVPWPQGMEAQAITTGPNPGGAQITLTRTDGLPFDITTLSFKLLANTAGAGGSLEIMPLVDGEDAYPDPVFFDATGYYGSQFTYTTAFSYQGSTARLTNFPTYKIKLYVDFALTGLNLVADTPNHAPTNLALSGQSVMENDPPGTSVGSFTTADPDPGDTFTYQLATGAGDTDNALFAISGDELLADASFNFEIRNTYSIRVAATDQDGLSAQKAFSIQVLDMEEAPPTLVTAPGITADGITLQWNSMTNHTYTILVSDDLQAGFTVLESGVAANPPVNDYTDPTPPGNLPRFWQILTDP